MSLSHFRPLLAVSALGLLAACGDGGAKTEVAAKPAAAPAKPADPAASTFVQTAVATDIFEIDASRVALERSQNWHVKKLAQEIIDARSKAGGELQVALSDVGIRPDTRLPADKAAAVEELRTVDVSQFDKKYLEAATEAQAQALEVVEKYAEEGATPALKAVAEKKAPELREQHAEARALKGRVG
jgi:putative membrane protein